MAMLATAVGSTAKAAVAAVAVADAAREVEVAMALATAVVVKVIPMVEVVTALARKGMVAEEAMAMALTEDTMAEEAEVESVAPMEERLVQEVNPGG